MCFLTLIDLKKGLREFACEQGLGQISKILLEHICDIIGRLALVGDSPTIRPAGLVHLAQSLDPRFHP